MRRRTLGELRTTRWLVTVCVLAPSVARAAADAGAPRDASRGLRVAVAGGVPFVIDEPRGPSGLSLEVWRAVAERAQQHYELTRASSVEEALDLVRARRADVAVGPISVTAERARQVRFTQPYFHAGLAILSRRELRPSQLLAPFLSSTFAAGVTLLLCVLTLVGTLIWLAERRDPAHGFPRPAGAGIGTGVWFALVTTTTVGYGDHVPKTPLGRVVAAVWMLIAVLSLSSLTAGIASSLTLAKIESASIQRVDQLRARRVAAVRGTSGASFVRALGASLVEAPDLAAAIASLNEGRSTAVVHDQPQLEYYLREHPDLRLSLSSQIYRTAGYGFVTSRGSELGDRINWSLLELAEEGRIGEITERWLGSP